MPSSDETRLAESAGTSTPKVGWLSSSDPQGGSGIAPGTMLAERYRIVSLLGRGGMGEVYRADDLRLGQPVALKFLPAAVADDATRLAQFHNEVRIARQISHPNVCRVYDIGEDRGRIFLTMEYVDGEDLEALLKRIGRLPPDKGVDIARQICAGLSAAHDQGVLHRDLKPANIMLDRAGRAKITDFGLAGVADEVQDVRSGTPAYMAPEQLAGLEVSPRSDVFALGLVLYEIFTGKRAFEARTVAELLRMHDQGLHVTPTTAVRDLDPAIEAVIQRCLEREPKKRPASARAVAAALPGGDPLAAALAAGETPSPDMVAAAGSDEALPVAYGLAAVAVVVLGLVYLVAIAGRLSFTNHLQLEKPPAVLEDRANEVRRALGYTQAPVDATGRLDMTMDYRSWVRQTRAEEADRWRELRTGRVPTLFYWHRTSPRTLNPNVSTDWPTMTDPPLTDSDMTLVQLDPRGRLLAFHAVPPQREQSAGAAVPPPDWRVVFQLADLPADRFTAATPSWTPRGYADQRAAWVGTIPELGATEVRLEAAAYRGRITFFQVVWPWTRATRMDPAPVDRVQQLFSIATSVLLIGLLFGAVLLARRNLLLGRGDRAGANRVALIVFGCGMVSWAFGSRHFTDVSLEVNRFFQACAEAIFAGAVFWLIYLALEPWVRRHWPDSLISWSRLMSRGFRDPLVGRDVLIGIICGIAFMGYQYAVKLGRHWTGQGEPSFTQFAGLDSVRFLMEEMFSSIENALLNGVLFALLYVLLRRLLRVQVVAAVGLVLAFNLFLGTEGAFGQGGIVEFLLASGFSVLVAATLLRFGLLTLTVAFQTNFLLQQVAWTTNLGAWYATPMILVMLCVLGATIFAFVESRAGAPLFGRVLTD